MDDAGFGEVPIVRMLLQREVLDGVDANVAPPQLVLLLNWGDQALQVLALNFSTVSRREHIPSCSSNNRASKLRAERVSSTGSEGGRSLGYAKNPHRSRTD